MTVQPLRVCLGLTLALEQVSRSGVGGDIWIYIASITSIIKVKPPSGSAPLLLGGTESSSAFARWPQAGVVYTSLCKIATFFYILLVIVCANL
jgi:hypothetical protein